MNLLRNSAFIFFIFLIYSCANKEQVKTPSTSKQLPVMPFMQLPLMLWKESIINIYNPEEFNEHHNSWAVKIELSNPSSDTILFEREEVINNHENGFFISYFNGFNRDTTQLSSLRKESILLLPSEKIMISLNGFLLNTSDNNEFILRASNILINGELFFLNTVEQNEIGVAVPSMFIRKASTYNCSVRYHKTNNQEILKPAQ
jgi:hypothetical protein